MVVPTEMESHMGQGAARLETLNELDPSRLSDYHSTWVDKQL